MNRYLSLFAITTMLVAGAGCGDDGQTGGPDLTGALPDLAGGDADLAVPGDLTMVTADLAGADLTGRDLATPPMDLAGLDLFGRDLAGTPCIQRTCQGKTYQCGDCIDNDNDGKTDSDDPDCQGACQNNESAFYGDIPGQNNAPCKMDCYFDQDTGSGNDTCEWDHACDPHEQQMNPEIGCTYDSTTKFPGGATCGQRLQTQTNFCKSFCGPLTPNGCDCFGCCVNPYGTSTTEGFFLGSLNSAGVPTCDVAHITDPTRCRPCQIVQGCFKGCAKCQLCVGKTDLPPECFGLPPDAGTLPDGGLIKPDGGFTAPDGGVIGQCPGGETPCGLTGQAPCPSGYYCVTGCCQPIIG